jgi:tetratricopeptide (TPR) repeat protein
MIATYVSSAPTAAQPTIADVDAHRRLRGPYTAAGSILRAVIPAILERRPDLVERHDAEILTAAPDLDALVENRRATLTSSSSGDERTRFYPDAHTRRVAHGIAELLMSWAEEIGGATIELRRMPEADATDAELVAILQRRADPARLRIVVRPPVAGGDEHDLRYPIELATAYVASECTSERRAEAEAYAMLEPALRARLHDDRATELEACGDRSLELGAIAFHREHGADPAAGIAALRCALERCLLVGCYDAVLELCPRALALMDWDADPRQCWLVVAKWVTALTAMGRADEAAALYADACSRTADPLVHLQAAYGRAMLHTRFYDKERRDHAKAKAEINIAIAISSLLDDERRRAFSLTFNENGLALIEMHLGDLHEALRLVDAGLERIEREFEPGQHALHRSVLRYNRAQLLTRVEGLPAAIEEYGRLIAEDPNHSEYRFDRAALHRKLGRYDEARADLDDAIRLSPPYPEAFYNRADLALELGDLDGALADFSRVLELDPEFPDAHLNRASVLLELGDVDGADGDVAAGLEVAPDDAHLHALRGDLLGLHDAADAADAAYAAALERDPSLAGAWANRAVLAFERGDVGAAIDLLTRALQAAGPDPTILANRAVAYEHAGRVADAADDLIAALEHEADPDERAELEARLRAVRTT